MSQKTQPKNRERMSQAKLDSLIINKPEPVEHPVQTAKPVLHSSEPYDTLRPEDKFKNFCAEIREMLSRYEGDKSRLNELENQMQDVLHFIEMSKDKDIQKGYQLYKHLCEVRRERRQCKNEIDLLQPVYDAFHGTRLLDMLQSVQGQCGIVKRTIDAKGYTVRTDLIGELF